MWCGSTRAAADAVTIAQKLDTDYTVHLVPANVVYSDKPLKGKTIEEIQSELMSRSADLRELLGAEVPDKLGA
jgi:hypothetical protein